MLIPVLIISSLVHIYSVGYMSHDPQHNRFFLVALAACVLLKWLY